ncbi:P-loop containing nucleoside triphosphate hydrolase protein [Marasmius fiardii PR-910]|nr:P-loop containing nucleoside triphosphate hydrolase protein [Marasmius fiardii PR-910]
MGDSSSSTTPSWVTRGYQREMLEESLRRNIIIAMDTGSGKTHIAVLRLKIEVERESRKISWFFAPTVSLCEQQHMVIDQALPVPVGLITGSKNPDQWKDTNLWRTVLEKYRVVVSTPQVLLDALRHGYIVMGRDISLLIFDEAHHAVEGDPYNRIMQEFYKVLPPRPKTTEVSLSDMIRPMIMGLTASPIYGGNVDRAFNMIEHNLDSVIVSPLLHREELAQYVHRPIFKHILYHRPNVSELFSPNLAALGYAIENLDIEDDPYVKSLRRSLSSISPGSAEYRRIDGKLSKVISKEDTFTHKGLRDCKRTAEAILVDVGYWAAEWFIWEVLCNAKQAADPLRRMMKTWKLEEKVYLLDIINTIHITPPSYAPDDVANGLSDKIVALIQCLLAEKEEAEKCNAVFSGLVFVQRRDVVLALKEVLSNHPVIASAFQVGSLLGTSDSGHRHSMMDITRRMVKETPSEILGEFRIGEKNLIVSTSVAEEGIDIQACRCVIRWDLPPNMASWAQSRGRARKERSTFVLMFEEDANVNQEVVKWEKLEREMVSRYTDTMRETFSVNGHPDEDDLRFEVPHTGALLTLQSAIPHLSHFCAVLLSRNLGEYQPIYDIDPPDHPVGWHTFHSQSQSMSLYQGPWNSTVTLPRVLPPEFRMFSTDRPCSNKVSAHQHAAFAAYRCLYENGFLNDNLLPFFVDNDEVKELKQEVEKRMSLVDVQKQIDPWVSTSESGVWYRSELAIGDLPPLHIFTQIDPAPWTEDNGPTLHIPIRGQLKVRLRPVDTVRLDDECITKARDHTRMLFWCLHGARMDWDKQDFSYLVLPSDDSEDNHWCERRSWAHSVQPAVFVNEAFHANARIMGEHYGFPADLTMIKKGGAFSRAYHFVRWRLSSEPLTTEERESLQNMYRDPDLEISFPLLVVEPFPSRSNFLIPLPLAATPPAPPKQILLIPARSSITVLSRAEVQSAFLLPSVLRALYMRFTVDSFRRSVLSGTPLFELSEELLTVALTAPVSQERKNYQRLETLGDAVLKYVVAVQVFDEYPVWPEGYLTKKKDHAVNNARLAKESMIRETFKWIIRDRMLAKKWKPAYLSPLSSLSSGTRAPVEPTSINRTESGMGEIKKKKKNQQEMSTKVVLADVIESLIGAAYEHSGIDMAYEAMRFFDLGLNWKPLSVRINSSLRRVDDTESRIIQIPEQVTHVEKIIGYRFTRKMLLVEALTHSSHQQDLGTISNERMEFLGDAVLDMIVNDYLYHATGKEYSPGHVYLRKVAVVNGHILAFICLNASLELSMQMPEPDEDGSISLVDESKTVHLWQCLLHSSTQVHNEQMTTQARFHRRGEEIGAALGSGRIFPWAGLTRLQAPKFFADMVESIFGAVYLDSGGDLEAVRGVIWNLGLLQILKRIVDEDIDILHPVSRLSMWAAKAQKKVGYEYVQASGCITCNILIDGEILEDASERDIYHGKASQEEVRLAAAEAAIQILHLRASEMNLS